jgi:integrase
LGLTGSFTLRKVVRAARYQPPVAPEHKRVANGVIRRHAPQTLVLIKIDNWLSGGHLTTVAQQFRDARAKAGLPKLLVLYCARHTFGTAAYEATGNLAMVMNVMGHMDVRTAMPYQHPTLDSVREAIDQRNLRHNPRHNEIRVQVKTVASD